MSSIIKVRGLTKSFNEITAVNELDFTVNSCEVYGFLGQNGAGKSTTIRTLLSLVSPDEGEIELFGLKLSTHRKEILRKTGAVIEKPDLYKYLSAFDNLRLFSIMSGLRLSRNEIMEKLDHVGLSARANSKINTFSQGMKQRLGIAVALVNDPELIILDEPMNGLDPQGIADIRKLIKHLSRDLGKTVFISSHLLSEMELVADSLLIIHKGKKVVEGKMNELLNPAVIKIEITTASAEMLKEELSKTKWHKYINSSTADIVTLNIEKDAVPILIKDIGHFNAAVYSINKKHTLEDYFLSITSN